IWVEFEILQAPSEGNLTSQIDISTNYPGDTWVMDYDLNYVNLNIYDADYTFIPEFTTIILIIVLLLSSTMIMIFKKKFN
ncbi:MAG: hypothetical protein ACTSV7_03165, partial [Candidatus Baldrarchaeia archaeon]